MGFDAEAAGEIAVEPMLDARPMNEPLSRIMDASNPTVIRSHDSKISERERGKLVLAERLARQAEPKGKFEEQLEPALTVLANPWTLWQTRDIALRRMTLELAFAERIEYCPNRGLEPDKSPYRSRRRRVRFTSKSGMVQLIGTT